MEKDIIQSNTKEHLINNNSDFHGDSSLQALNHDGLNTLVLGDKINKNTFPDVAANFQNYASGIDQYGEQIKTFSKQSKLLNLMGDKTGASKKIDKVVNSLTQSRDKTIQQAEQLALTLKGTQFFNTVDLEDYVLVNNKGLGTLSGKEMRQEQVNLFKAAHGDDHNMTDEDEKTLVGEDDKGEEQPNQEEQQPQEEQKEGDE